MKILVVDDSVSIRSMIAKYLAEMGLTDVDHAEDGEQAIVMTLKEGYGLVLLDWNMPKKSGLDVLKLIRARGNKVPVIMITTETAKRQVIEAIKAGVSDYIFKPFVKETLTSKVRRAVGASV